MRDKIYLQVKEIYEHYVTLEEDVTTFEEVVPDEEEMERRRKEIMETQKMPFVVAEMDSEIVGYAYAKKFRSRSAYRFSVEESVYLRQDCRGKGIGSRLMEELLGALGECGVKVVMAVLATKEDNPASVALHKKFGFSVNGIFPGIGFKHGKPVTRYFMQKRLLDTRVDDEGDLEEVVLEGIEEKRRRRRRRRRRGRKKEEQEEEGEEKRKERKKRNKNKKKNRNGRR